MTKFYYETIVCKTIYKKNGSKKTAACAKTSISNNRDGYFKIEVSKFGKKQEDAKEKIIKLLPKGAECIGRF